MIEVIQNRKQRRCKALVPLRELACAKGPPVFSQSETSLRLVLYQSVLSFVDPSSILRSILRLLCVFGLILMVEDRMPG